jgi:hypothetical protein
MVMISGRKSLPAIEAIPEMLFFPLENGQVSGSAVSRCDSSAGATAFC